MKCINLESKISTHKLYIMNFVRLACQMLVMTGIMAFSSLGFAQTGDAGVETTIKQHLQSFAEAYAKLPESKNKQSVLRHFSRDMQSNIFYFGISGRTRATNSNYEGFSVYLDKLLSASGMMIKYDVKEVLYVRVIDDVATAVVNVTYEMKEEDGIWVKGEETASYALQKQADGWKIVHLTVMGMEDEKLKGSCLCELFVEEGSASGVVTKTTVPAGRSYSTHFNDFSFRASEGNWIIKAGDKLYRWERAGNLFKMDESGIVQPAIGSSNSKKDIVLLILAKDLYGDNCANIKVKASK